MDRGALQALVAAALLKPCQLDMGRDGKGVTPFNVVVVLAYSSFIHLLHSVL